jgi:hypothetical protein
MDLNVKLQRLKYNYENVRVVFVKFQAPAIFLVI